EAVDRCAVNHVDVLIARGNAAYVGVGRATRKLEVAEHGNDRFVVISRLALVVRVEHATVVYGVTASAAGGDQNHQAREDHQDSQPVVSHNHEPHCCSLPNRAQACGLWPGTLLVGATAAAAAGVESVLGLVDVQSDLAHAAGADCDSGLGGL